MSMTFYEGNLMNKFLETPRNSYQIGFPFSLYYYTGPLNLCVDPSGQIGSLKLTGRSHFLDPRYARPKPFPRAKDVQYTTDQRQLHCLLTERACL